MKLTDFKNKSLPSGLSFRNAVRALLILLIGLIFTAVATFFVHRKVETDAKHEFATICNEIKIKTANRLRACAQLLRTGSAFFVTSDTVSRKDWKTFSEYSKIETYLPGIQGTGYSIIIPKVQLHQHIQAVQTEGFPDYSVKPAGDRPFYTSVIYLEPFSGSNLRAFGYDMFSDSVRKKAMELSRDSDAAVLTGKVILVQNAKEDLQTGISMYVPVYRKGMPVNTLVQRRAAIKGWVFGTYQMNELMQGIIGQYETEIGGPFRLQIFDENNFPHMLLFDSQRNDTLNNSFDPTGSVTFKVTPYNINWNLVFNQPIHPAYYLQSIEQLVLISGILISLLLFLLTFSLLNSEHRAQQIADKLTFELKNSEKRIREVLENSSDASYKRNFKTRNYDYLSPAYSRISGYTIEEMSGILLDTIIGFIHPEDSSLVNRSIAEAMSDTNNMTHYLEYRFRHKDGQYRWFQDRFIITRDDQNQPLSLFGSVSDITDRKKMEEALRAEQLLLRTLIDNIPDSIYCLDLECRKTLANAADLRYMGAHSEEEVIGKTDFDFYPKEIAEKFFEVDSSVIRAGKPLLNIEEFMIGKNGETHWLLTSKLPMYNNEGKIIGLLGYGRDITERKRAEEEIRAKNEELQKINTSKDKLFSIIAHDLRSPFNGFLGLTQMMAEDISSMTLDEIRKIAEAIQNSAATIYRLLENLLQWSTLQQGRMAFNPQGLRLISILTDSIAMSLQPANQKEIEIESLISDDLEVYADSNMLQTIFRNLVANSVKFTKKGGKITFSARTTDDKTLEILIQDTGIGMSKEILKGLFLIDVNTSRKGTDGESSTGLGLIICKEFVELNGGKIWVESEEGVGSKFYFTIPANVNHT